MENGGSEAAADSLGFRKLSIVVDCAVHYQTTLLPAPTSPVPARSRIGRIAISFIDGPGNESNAP